MQDIAPKQNYKFRVHPGERPKKTFFYQRLDGSIFACEEKEAASVHHKLKQVGVSDGTTFFKRMKELESLYPNPIPLDTPEGQRTLEEIKKKIQEAWDAELEVARGHFETPGDQSVEVIASNPIEAARLKKFLMRTL